MQQESLTTLMEADCLAVERTAAGRRLRVEQRRADRRVCRTFANAQLRIPLLLHIRDGRWHAWHDAVAGLEPHVPQDIASRRYLLDDCDQATAAFHHLVQARYLFLADLAKRLGRQRLVETRIQPDGLQEIRATPFGDPRFTIDAEFETQLPRLPGEVAALEASLLREPCRDPIIVWKERRLLVDGHARVRFLWLLGKRTYDVVEMSFPNRDAVIEWIWATHLGRRNSSEEAKSYWRGTRYLAEDRKRGGDRRSSRAKSGCTTLKKPAETLALSYRVSRATIYEDARFAHSLNRVSGVASEQARQKILSREWAWTRRDVNRLAAFDDDQMKEIVQAAIATGKRPKFVEPGERRQSIVLPEKTSGRVRVLIDRIGMEQAVVLAKALLRTARKQERQPTN